MRVYITDAGDDEQKDDADLHHHDDRIEICRFLNSPNEKCGNRERDQHRRKIEDGGLNRDVQARLLPVPRASSSVRMLQPTGGFKIASPIRMFASCEEVASVISTNFVPGAALSAIGN